MAVAVRSRVRTLAAVLRLRRRTPDLDIHELRRERLASLTTALRPFRCECLCCGAVEYRAYWVEVLEWEYEHRCRV